MTAGRAAGEERRAEIERSTREANEMRISMYGASDDLIEVEGNAWYQGQWSPTGDEFSGYSSETIHETFLLLDVKNMPRLQVLVLWERGCWCFAPGLLEEDWPYPDWRIVIENGPENSMRLTVEGDDLKGAIRDEDWRELQGTITALG